VQTPLFIPRPVLGDARHPSALLRP
jgi:hypothetical protein